MTAIYDNEKFFKEYSHMLRSQEGLKGAGEWETFKALMPEVANKSILDIGCGYGWHCQYVAEQGATEVVGIDNSDKMLAVAREKNEFTQVTYENMPVEAMDFEANQFDLVLSSLVFHYIADFDALIKSIKRVLKAQGQLIFTVEHPVFTAEGSEQWVQNDDGENQFFPVDNYFYEGARDTDFLNTSIKKYHRTLTTYIETLIQNGFKINHVVEPMPSEDMRELDGMADEMRRPMMLIISAELEK